MHAISGSGEPVVFVHGNGSTHETWNEVIAAMDGRGSCISYDLRGHSPTAPALAEATLDIFVQDLEDLRCELGLDRFHLVGQSLGAFISAAYSLAHPERVRGLALLAAPAGRGAAAQEALSALITRFKREGVMQVMPDLVRHWYTDAFAAAHPASVGKRLAQIATIDEDVFIRTYELYGATEILPWLGAIKHRTLVMTGEFAQGCGASVARLTAETIEEAKLVILDGLKNGLLTESPQRVATELVSVFGLESSGKVGS
jgi:3-oxoadipate enol-lactonase